MTIAVDFDGCLCENKWPDIGKANQPIIYELVRRQAQGDRLILWTCREGMMLDAAIMWCLNHGLRFAAINDNLPENIALYGNNCRKVWADEYWDDKSVIVTASEDMEKVVLPREDGGLTVKRWTECQAQFAEPGHIAVVPDLIRKMKRWWQRWRCE